MRRKNEDLCKRSILMNSPIYNEWIEEEIKEAAAKAAKEAAIVSAKKHIMELLSAKFDFVPKSIKEDVENLEDLSVLEELFKKQIKVNSLEEFKELLEKAKGVE
jgi:aminoglycoside/choline kinase family phosphotransferase